MVAVPELQAPVIDRTDLTGLFDFELVFDPGPRGGSTLGDDDALTAAPAPPLRVAIEEQLGLRLRRESGPVRVLVVEHVEPPTPN